jgi:hypothetical protein
MRGHQTLSYSRVAMLSIRNCLSLASILCRRIYRAALLSAMFTLASVIPSAAAPQEDKCDFRLATCKRYCSAYEYGASCVRECNYSWSMCMIEINPPASMPTGKPPKRKFPGPGLLESEPGLSPQGPSGTGRPGSVPVAPRGPVLR